MRAGVCGVLAAFLLTGCLPSHTIDTAHAVDSALENETDAVLHFALDRICSLPVDIMGRASADADMARAMFYGCPQVRGLALNVMRAVGSGGLDINVTVEPAP